MNNPRTIFKLWQQAVKRHEDGKKAEQLNKVGQAHKTKIKNGLTILRKEAGGDLTDASARKVFEVARDRAALLMRKYCRYLKAAKDEDKKVLPKHFKAVKQLTVVVENLDPGQLDM